MVTDRGYRMGNLDVMILAEEPRIRPYADEMRRVLAGLFVCSVHQVSIKATTLEGLGFIGRREGIAAQAVVVLEPVGQPSDPGVRGGGG
jgi:2-C-methyl-D-erythritol 2,4-cyclodiphosphate synthase